MRENWMFKLVGRECFSIGKHKCVINIDSSTGFAYEYTLEVIYLRLILNTFFFRKQFLNKQLNTSL